MQTAKVVLFDSAKGYGFLDVGPGEPQLFVHWTAIQQEGYKKLKKGQIVAYETETGPSGRSQACNVQVIETRWQR